MNEYLWDTAPWCGQAACYVHPVFGRALEVEHHVSPCPATETFAATGHGLSHAFNDLGAAAAAAGVDIRALARQVAFSTLRGRMRWYWAEVRTRLQRWTRR